MSISRDELVRRLAEVSHLTYIRQKNRDYGVPLDQLTLEVSDHDRERAEDTVAELERLGIYRESDITREPAADTTPGTPPSTTADHDPDPAPDPAPEPPRIESKGQPLTDIWGNPITRRRGRNR